MPLELDRPDAEVEAAADATGSPDTSSADAPQQRTVERIDRGFVAQLDGVTIWDLVQMECLSGSRKAVRVRSGAKLGYLFFDGGHMVHAVQGTLVGERAAQAILGWTRGEVAPCDLRWPRVRTVNTPWQSLLMHAAQRRDEHARSGRPDSTVVSIDAGRRDHASSQRDAPSEVAVEEDDVNDGSRASTAPAAQGASASEPEPATQERSAEKASPPDGAFGPLEYIRAVRLDADGDIVANLGQDEELAGQASYAMRLSDLLGEMLSLGPVMSMEARTAHPGEARTAHPGEARTAHGSSQPTPVFAYRDREGGVVALQPAHSNDAARIRRELGI